MARIFAPKCYAKTHKKFTCAKNRTNHTNKLHFSGNQKVNVQKHAPPAHALEKKTNKAMSIRHRHHYMP